MVLSEKQIPEQINLIKSYPFDYLVLETKNLRSHFSNFHFSMSIEVLGLINSVGYLNKLFFDLGSPNKLDPEVLYKVIDFILRGSEFTKEDLKKYFKLTKEIEYCYCSLWNFSDIMNELPFEIELELFGVTHSTFINKLDYEQRCVLTEDYGILQSEFFKSKEMTFEMFSVKVESLISETFKSDID
ncbi:hypothetical protein [Formosa sp. A9]|uniref:hypothetical protein n=1 Tax=Formosa sp. A9 TaxID=3442641 RepID=UPI003EBE6E5A